MKELRTYRIGIRVTKTEYELLKASKTISKGIRQDNLLCAKIVKETLLHLSPNLKDNIGGEDRPK